MLLNFIKHQEPDTDNIYVKDPLKSKYQMVINGREKTEIENLIVLKEFVDYSQKIDDVSDNLEE